MQPRSDGEEFQTSQTKIPSALMPTRAFQAFQYLVASLAQHALLSFLTIIRTVISKVLQRLAEGSNLLENAFRTRFR